MPRYVSINGKWSPAKEYHINKDAKPGENPVYEGPDRAATEELKSLEVEYIGNDCRLNEENLTKARQLGCKDIEEYLIKFKNVSLKENEAKQVRKLNETIHLDESIHTPAKPVRVQSGGDDTSGQGKHILGGFGDHSEAITESKKK